MKLIITDIENFKIPIERKHKVIKPKSGIKQIKQTTMRKHHSSRIATFLLLFTV